ncbi:MAG: GIY-YIG nuclease family protein [Verrucomicrobiae bacterium]|nr:GIY-YIG nuclease family protein [Verrucomicrobiae bacterium]
MYQVYILQNPKNRYYIGISENIEVRLAQHNNNQSRWTKNKGPWQLIWQSATMTLSEARKLENKLKRQKTGNGFYQMTGLNRTC